MELTTNQMAKINGGAINFGVLAAIGSGLAFVIGFFSGYTNPSRCSN